MVTNYPLNGLLLKNTWLPLPMAIISQVLNLTSISLLRKASRQNWLYSEQIEGVGSPTRYYPLSTLPDEIQVAWASWDLNKQQDAIIREQGKGEKGRPGAVPDATSVELAAEALSWPIRNAYYQKIPPEPGKRKGRSKVYDGFSTGLCQDARDILLNRFPQLAHIQPAPPELRPDPKTAGSFPQNKDTIYSVPPKAEPDTIYNTPEPPAEKSVREMEIEGLKRLLEEKDKALEEKERMIQSQERMITSIQTMSDQKDDFIQMQKEIIAVKTAESQEKSLEISLLKRELESAEEEHTRTQAS